MRHSAIIFILFLGLLSTGCEDSPEHKMGMASIAMRNGDPSQALDHVNSVLLDQPDNLAALKIKGTAHLRLRQYAECEKTLLQLLEKTPDDVDVHRELINWAYSTMAFNLSKSDFIADDVVREDFTRAKTIGHKHADWLANNETTKTEAEFIRARLILLDSRHLEIRLKHEKFLIRDQVLSADGGDVTSPTIEELNRQIRSMKFTAERHVQNVMVENPEHFDSAMIYVNLLVEREGWSALWVMVEKLKGQKVTPPHLASKVVETVLKMPNQYHPRKERLEACQAILDTVEKTDSPSFMMIQARIFMEMEKIHNAYELAEQLFKIQSNDHETRYLYGWTLYELEKYELAKTTISPLAAEFAGHAPVQSLYGRILIKLGDERGAIYHLRRALEVKPDLFLARSALIKVLANNQDTENAAFEDIKSLYEKNPGDPIAIRYMMRAFIARDERMKVENLIEKVLLISPLTADHIHGIVGGYAYLKDFPKAIQYAKELLRREPESPNSHLVLASVHFRKGEIGEAKKILQEIQKRNPDSVPVNMRLAQMHLLRGQYDQAMELAEAVLDANPNDADARMVIAQSMNRLSLVEDALEQIALILQVNSAEPRANELAARIYRQMNEHEKAEMHLKKIDESAINVSRFPGVVARLKLEKGYTDEALAICNNAITKGNATPLIRQLLVEIQLGNKKDFAQGEIHLLAYAREHPNDTVPFTLLTQFYIKHNKDRGVTKFRELRKVNETLARLSEAQLYFQYGRKQDAIKTLAEHYPRLIKNKDTLALTYATMLSQLLASQDTKDFKQITSVWNALIYADVYRHKATFALLQIKRRSMKPSQYQAELNEIGQDLPTSEFGLFHRVVTQLSGSGDQEGALKLVDKWLDLKPSNASLLGMKGDVLKRAKRFNEALLAYREAVKFASEPDKILIRIADVYRDQNNFPATASTMDEWASINPKTFISASWAKARLFIRTGLRQQALNTIEIIRKATRENDPRVSMAIADAYIQLSQTDEALKALLIIPSVAKQYPLAQVLIARIESNDKSTKEQGRKRLERLGEQHPEARSMVGRELLIWAQRTGDFEQLLAWAEEAAKNESLSLETRAGCLMIRANLKAKQGDWPSVDTVINDFLAIAPQNKTWQMAKVVLFCFMDKTDEAKSYIDQHPDLKSEPAYPLIAAAIGNNDSQRKLYPLDQYFIAMASGQPDAAIKAVDSIQRTSDVLFPQDLRDAAMAAKEDESAAAAYRQLALATAAGKIGFFQVANAIAAKTTKQYPKCIPAHALFLTSLKESSAVTAKERSKAIESIPGSSLSIYLQIRKIDKTDAKQLNQAIQLAMKLHSREKDHYPTTAQLISLHILANNREEALGHLKHWSEKPGVHRATVANNLAYLLATKFENRLDEAYKIGKQATELAPESTIVFDTLGWIEYQRGKYPEAVKLLSKAWPSHSQTAEWHYHMGMGYAATNVPQWARFHLQAATDLGGESSLLAKQALEEMDAKP